MKRRTVLAGLASVMATPAWAQFPGAIQPQSDPWAQVDPYDDPRNGFATGRGGGNGGAGRGLDRPQAGGPSPFAQTPANLQAVSAEEERQEIARASKNLPGFVSQTGGLLPDKRVQQAMNDLCAPLFKACDRKTLPWEIVVNRAQGFQAVAFGGGKMVMYPQTIMVCDHPGELAAIVAHEMGHNVHSHITKRMQTTELVIRQAENGPAAHGEGALKALGVSGLDALLKSYGRENEYEADAYIIVMFERLGVHPGHALSVYEKMMRFYGESPNEDNSLFSTHPGTLDRMQRLADQVRTLPAHGQDFRFAGWEVLKAALPTPSAFRNG